MQHGPFCLIHRAYSSECILHQLSFPNVQSYNCNSMKCHPCAGAMHGHEYSAKCFGLLLGNVEHSDFIPTPFWHGCCAQTSTEIPIWDYFGPSGIMVTGSCHYSPARKSLPLANMAFWLRGVAIIPRHENFLWTYVALQASSLSWFTYCPYLSDRLASVTAWRSAMT